MEETVEKKGTINIIMILGMIVIFTSVLFMFFTFDQFISDTIDCSVHPCKIKAVSVSSAFGGFLILMFLVIDTLVFWLIVKNVMN